MTISDIWVKTLSELEIQGNFFNLIKDICGKPTTGIILKWNTACLTPSRTTRRPTLTTFIQHCLGVSSQGNKARKRNERYPELKGRCKTAFSHRWHNCLCRKSYRIYGKKTTTTNKYIWEVYKINTLKSMVFLHNSRKWWKWKLKEKYHLK